MKILPTGAITRLGLRLGERRRRFRSDGGPALTDADRENILEFEAVLEGAIRLLEQENRALVDGDVAMVASFHEAKEQMLRDLTLRQPVVEPFLRDGSGQVEKLRDLLRLLSSHLKANGELLSGMASASRSVLAEVERIRRRESLDGVYDKTGQLRKGMNREAGRVVKNL